MPGKKRERGQSVEQFKAKRQARPVDKLNSNITVRLIEPMSFETLYGSQCICEGPECTDSDHVRFFSVKKTYLGLEMFPAPDARTLGDPGEYVTQITTN